VIGCFRISSIREYLLSSIYSKFCIKVFNWNCSYDVKVFETFVVIAIVAASTSVLWMHGFGLCIVWLYAISHILIDRSLIGQTRCGWPRAVAGLCLHTTQISNAYVFNYEVMDFRYPKDAEKHLLAIKSGLTRSQVLKF
jgi:hypothetical protein